MSSNWSDARSVLSDSSLESFDTQIESIHRAIENERKIKALSIIAVVPEDSIHELAALSRKRWWQFWRGKSLVLVTTPLDLQRAIRQVNRKKEHRQNMIIMGNTEVEEVDFDVPRSVKSLEVLRCGHEQDKRGQMAIASSARFANTEMSNWTARPRRSRELYIGSGVVIRATASNLSTWAGSTATLSSSERMSIEDYFSRMEKTDMSKSWWKKWKGLVASIAGIAVTGTKLGLATEASASGFYFSVNALGLGTMKLGAGKAAASTVLTAAGPAVLLGATTAAAVYFIDWRTLLEWFQNMFSGFWSWLGRLWRKFQMWLTESRQYHQGRPMFM